MQEIERLKIQQIEIKESVIQTLNAMKNCEHKNLLYNKYINLMSWKDVSERLYQFRHCIPQDTKVSVTKEFIVEISTNEHRRALKEFYQNMV